MSILVVGAGPVGLTLAVTLRKMGVLCRLIDKAAQPTNQSRAAILHARTLEVFERLGLVSPFLAAGVRVYGMQVRSGWDNILLDVTLGGLPTEYPFFLGLNQATTEKLLTGEFERLGGVVERSVSLTGLEDSGKAVVATLQDGHCKESKATFAYVAGCDGGHSTVRHLLGLPFEGETLDTQWITADVRIDWDFPGDKALGCLSPSGLGFIARMDRDRWRIILNAPDNIPIPAEQWTLEKIQALCVDRFGMPLRLHDPAWISPFGVNTRMVPRMRVGRIFLAGDAAHVHSPVGGQGMNTGIQDAFNLGWKLALAAQGQAGDRLLETYNEERHLNASRLLALVGPATRVVNWQGSWAVSLRNTAMKLAGMLGAGGIMARRVSELDVNYRGCSAFGEHLPSLKEWVAEVAHEEPAPWMTDCWDFSRGPHPGERAPDAHGLVRLPGDLGTRVHQSWQNDLRWHLLVFSGVHPRPDRLDHLVALADRVTSLYGDKMTTHLLCPNLHSRPNLWIDSGLEAHHAYGARQECLYLVRPDGYVGFRSQPALWEPLNAYFSGIMA
jgi:2-polyprenyl-6-methoxyphenol hydroxylase-like FAD-dependent oxidoreductase